MPKEPVAQYYLGLGIDEASQEWALDPASALSAGINTRVSKRGGVDKRLGHTGLGKLLFDGTTIDEGGRLFAHGKQLCLADFHKLYAYSPAGSRWVEQDRLPECTQVRRSIIETPWEPGCVDAVSVGSFIVVAYTIDNSASGFTEAVAVVVDPTSWAVVHGPVVLQVALQQDLIKLTKVGTTCLAIYSDGANTLSASSIDCASAASVSSGWSGLGALYSDLAAAPANWDTSWSSSGDRAYLAYNDNSTVGYSVVALNAAGSQLQARYITAGTPDYVALAEEVGGTLFMAYEVSGTVYVIGLDHDNLNGTPIGTAASAGHAYTNQWFSVVASSATAGQLFTSEATSWGLSAQRPFTIAVGAVSMSAASFVMNGVVQYTCRHFLVDGRYYSPLAPFDVVATGLYDESVAICDIDRTLVYPRPVSNGTALLAPFLDCWDEGLSHIVSLDSYRKAIPTVTKRNSSPDAFTIDLLVLDFRDTRRWSPCPLGIGTMLAAGTPVSYDGSQADEVNFVWRPSAPSAAAGAAGLVSAATSLYYICVYRAVDAQGNEIVSGTSDPSSNVGAVASKQIDLSIPAVHATARRAAASGLRTVFIDVYRNLDAAGYRYVGTQVQDLFTNTASYSFTDNVPQSTVAAAAKLYRFPEPGSVGAALQREAPPPLHFPVELNGTVVGFDDSLRVLRICSQSVDGEQPWFSTIWQYPIAGGDGTGLAVLDGRLLIFHQHDVWLCDGSAPADNGAGGLGTPQRLSSDVGCIEPRSVLTTSAGVFFQSERGIELMTRSLEVVYIGEPVQDTLSSYPVITSAVLDAKNNVAIFTLTSSETSGATASTGPRLVYDLSIQRWVSTDQITSYLGTANRAAQDACIVYENSAWRYAWVDSGGYVHTENASDAAKAHLDVGASDTWVTMTAVTGWTRLRGPSAEQLIDRAILLTRRESDLDANVYIGYDYSDSYSTTKQWLHAATTGKTKMLLDAETGNERLGESVRVKFTDATPTSGTVGTGQGCTLVALTYEGEARSGARRTNSGER